MGDKRAAREAETGWRGRDHKKAREMMRKHRGREQERVREDGRGGNRHIHTPRKNQSKLKERQ